MSPEGKTATRNTMSSPFSLFFLTLQHLPITYQSFLYRRSELAGADGLAARMKQDIVNLLFDELEYFQSFDKVKVYYDDGQNMVASALHAAVEYALSKESVLYRKTKSSDFLLSQAADMICTFELTACKFHNHESTSTDERELLQEQLHESRQKEASSQVKPPPVPGSRKACGG